MDGGVDDWYDGLTSMYAHDRSHQSRLNSARYFFLPTQFHPRKTMPKPLRVSLKTPLFRGSFVNFDKPRARKNEDGSAGKAQFSVLIVVPKDKKSTKVFIEALTAALVACGVEKHGAAIMKRPDPKNKGKFLKRAPDKAFKHWPIHDGDDSENEAFHGHYTINAASNFKPSVIDVNGDELTTADEMYSGAWYKAKISPWAWANDLGGKGVSVNLESAIKIKDDTRFGGGSDAKKDFEDEVSEDEAGDEDEGMLG